MLYHRSENTEGKPFVYSSIHFRYQYPNWCCLQSLWSSASDPYVGQSASQSAAVVGAASSGLLTKEALLPYVAKTSVSQEHLHQP